VSEAGAAVLQVVRRKAAEIDGGHGSDVLPLVGCPLCGPRSIRDMALYKCGHSVCCSCLWAQINWANPPLPAGVVLADALVQMPNCHSCRGHQIGLFELMLEVYIQPPDDE
jgi:hypothetical protein